MSSSPQPSWQGTQSPYSPGQQQPPGSSGPMQSSTYSQQQPSTSGFQQPMPSLGPGYDDPSGMSSFEYAALEELDPSLVEGFQLFYEREVPFELRSAAAVDFPTEVGALEAIRVKVLVRGEANRPQAVRLELSSESNLFFHYVHDMSDTSFRQVQEAQRLMVDFVDYPTALLRLLNQCIREPHLHLAVFIMQPNGEARLDFIHNMEYKFVEMLSASFVASPEDIVRQQVTYRYNVVKARMLLMQARLVDVNALIKIKSPSLLLQLQRTPPRVPGLQPSPTQGGRPFYS